MKNTLYVNWFKSPAHLVKFVSKNRIRQKNIVAINRYDNQLELWFWSKKLTHQHEDKGKSE